MGNRFWEFYLVRYLLGTIFAIVILFYLFYNYNDKISHSFFWSQEFPQSAQLVVSSFLFDTTYTLQDDKANSLMKWMQEILKSIGFQNITDSFWSKNLNINLTQSGITVLTTIILSVAGFLYMYFSSMLILVLHGVRAVLINFWIDNPEINQDVNENNNLVYQKIKGKMISSIESLKQFHKKERYISIFILLILLIVFLIIAIIFFTDLWRHSVSIMIVIFAYLLLTTVYSLNYKFYKQLSEYRAKKERIESGFKLSELLKKLKPERKSEEEFIESYKHLREHGNAFGIIVCEILFAFWLVFWGFSFWAIFYWSLIGFSSWIFGTYLEVKIVSEYKKQE